MGVDCEFFGIANFRYVDRMMGHRNSTDEDNIVNGLFCVVKHRIIEIWFIFIE